MALNHANVAVAVEKAAACSEEEAWNGLVVGKRSLVT